MPTYLRNFYMRELVKVKKEEKKQSDKARKKSFQARHAKNIAKGVFSAAYWANKVKW